MKRGTYVLNFRPIQLQLKKRRRKSKWLPFMELFTTLHSGGSEADFHGACSQKIFVSESQTRIPNWLGPLIKVLLIDKVSWCWFKDCFIYKQAHSYEVTSVHKLSAEKRLLCIRVIVFV